MHLGIGRASEDCPTFGIVRPVLGAALDEVYEVGALGGDGGVIVMDADGRPAFAMNTEGMYRGQMSSTEPAAVAIYADEEPEPVAP